MLFPGQTDDVVKVDLSKIGFDDAFSLVVDSVDALINIVLVDPAFSKEIMDSAPGRVLGEGDRVIDFQVSVPETGRHGNFVLSHVFKDDFGPVFCCHRAIVLRHCSYFLRHSVVANRFRQISLPLQLCNGVVARFIMAALYGDGNGDASGSQRVRFEKTAGLPIQRESGASPGNERMYENDLSRLKTVGTNRGTDAVEAPAPRQIGTLVGASAGVTAANHARTASTKASDGGGQRARV